ncbi:MAG: hypothetical protein EXR72_06280 [Myxococcales bacterium]|nr:hypothetical protein [Myxococcales bacterium]
MTRITHAIAVALALALAAPSAYADPAPRRETRQRRLTGRDLASVFWLPFAIFTLGSDSDGAKASRPKAKAAKRRGIDVASR